MISQISSFDEIILLANELEYPQAVINSMTEAASALPENLPVEMLAAPDTAEKGWAEIISRIPRWEEDNGIAQLAVTTAAACLSRKKYQLDGISDEIYLDTMRCLSRFLKETKEMRKIWAFDRGFWSWRQTGMLLFRLGTLEFEYRMLDHEEPLPEGLRPGDPVVSVHIPSDAVLKRDALDHSYSLAGKFFSSQAGGPWIQNPPKAFLCDSWLLAPTLDILLPDTSGIRTFSSDYKRYHELQDDDAFYQWLYQLSAPIPNGNLPEKTSLQRSLKAHLLSGGHMGMAWGILR